MRDRLHYQARADQFLRHAELALTDTERRGYLELADKYRALAANAASAEPSPQADEEVTS